MLFLVILVLQKTALENDKFLKHIVPKIVVG